MPNRYCKCNFRQRGTKTSNTPIHLNLREKLFLLESIIFYQKFEKLEGKEEIDGEPILKTFLGRGKLTYTFSANTNVLSVSTTSPTPSPPDPPNPACW